MVATALSAQDLFREAFESRYTWDEHFPGYQAQVTYCPSGCGQGSSFHGQVSIDRQMKINVVGIEDDLAWQSVRGQMWEIMVHRVRHSFDQEHGNHTFSYGDPQEDGKVEVLVQGLSATDRYWVKDKHIQMVHRHFHDRVITILVQEFYDTGEGYIPIRYTAEYQDLNSGAKLGSKLVYEDQYRRFGSYWIPIERKIWRENSGDTRPESEVFQFSEIRLISEQGE
ncbi:MAG: DUF3386 domain-containing protein [Thermostichus sp. DG02_5_bins_236]